MAAAIRGYRMVLIMPEDLSVERRADHAGLRRRADPDAALGRHGSTRATSPSRCATEGKGLMLDQFANPDNPRVALRDAPGPEIWRDTGGPHHPLRLRDGHHRHHHGLLALPEGEEPGDRRSSAASPSEGSHIPGIRKWPRGLPAEDLRPHARRPRRERQPGRRRGDGAAPGARGGHLRRHLLRRRAGWRCASPREVRERDHRLRRLRPRRPLPVDRASSPPERRCAASAAAPPACCS